MIPQDSPSLDTSVHTRYCNPFYKLIQIRQAPRQLFLYSLLYDVFPLEFPPKIQGKYLFLSNNNYAISLDSTPINKWIVFLARIVPKCDVTPGLGMMTWPGFKRGRRKFIHVKIFLPLFSLGKKWEVNTQYQSTNWLFKPSFNNTTINIHLSLSPGHRLKNIILLHLVRKRWIYL